MTKTRLVMNAALCVCALGLAAGTALAADDFRIRSELDSRPQNLCVGEAAIGNLFADALRKQNDADVGLINCGAIRGNKIYPEGASFTPVAVAFELPQGRKTTIVEVTGEQLLEVLEHAVSALPAVSPAFLQVSGLRMDVDTSKPVGTRIVKLTVNGGALEFAKTYRVATTDELAGGGEGFASLKSGKQVGGATKLVADDASAYLTENGMKDVKRLGRIDILR